MKRITSKSKDADVIKNMKSEARDVITEIDAKKIPKIKLPLRGLSNVYFDEKEHMIKLGDKTQTRTFFNVNQAKKFMQTFLAASVIKDLIGEEITTSIRSLYYNSLWTIGNTKEETWDDQNESDAVIEDLELLFGALREELHLRANSKGSMVGDITIVDTGDEINLRKMGSGGWAVPSIVEPNIIQFKDCDAKFVLFIEKDTVWGRFNEDKFWKKHNCIIIHGGGQPSRGVRRLLRRMHDELKLPVFVLVDNDVWGLYIYSVIKQGSINLAYESKRMAVPKARFLGLTSYDQDEYGLSKSVVRVLTDVEKKRIGEVLNYPWFKQKQWQDELKHMLKKGVRLELESLSSKNFKFITEKYVPEKIAKKQWLE